MQLCNLHSRPLLKVGGRSVCASCLGEKSLPALELSMFRAQKELDDNFARRLCAARIPRLFSSSTFDDYETKTDRQERMKESLKRYAMDFETQRGMRPGLLFSGDPGGGKTHIACAIAKIVVGLGLSAKYTSLPDLTMRVRASYKNDEISVSEIVKDLVMADFLILDEIDLHGSSDTDYQILYEIINGRYSRGNAPTLAISNRKLSELVKDLDERIMGRILGDSKPIIFD